jgi:hypothetical protein
MRVHFPIFVESVKINGILTGAPFPDWDRLC